MDKMLEGLYQMAWNGKIEIGIWLVIPGATISGRLTSAENFVSVLIEHPMFGNWGKEILQDVKEERDRVETEDEENEATELEYLHLIDVLLSFNPQPVQIPWAKIRINDIAAWGLGSIEIMERVAF